MGARLNRQWWTLQVSRFMIVHKLYKNSFDSEDKFPRYFSSFFFFSKKLKFSFLVKLSVTNSFAVIANLTKKIHFFFFYPLKSDHDKHFRFSIFFSSYIVELRTMDEKCFKRRVIQEITFFRSSSNLFFSHFPRI